jgi:YfiH family protein
MIVPLLRSNALAMAGFSHGFTTRRGGVSPPPYDTLDFAVLRDPSCLRENQKRLAVEVGFDEGRLHQAMQVHGKTVLAARGDPKATRALEADALVAEPRSSDAVAVRVADCVPVLLADPSSGRVAAVHAGWRGVVAGVLASTMDRLVGGTGAGSVSGFVAAIGPSIGPCCFEVGRDVAGEITAASAPEVVRRWASDKAYVDLRAAVRIQLRALGLGDRSIEDVPGCTRCDRERFYSYRRDGDASGRLMAVIVAR